MWLPTTRSKLAVELLVLKQEANNIQKEDENESDGLPVG
jgi:hypothetical protein